MKFYVYSPPVSRWGFFGIAHAGLSVNELVLCLSVAHSHLLSCRYIMAEESVAQRGDVKRSVLGFSLTCVLGKMAEVNMVRHPPMNSICSCRLEKVLYSGFVSEISSDTGKENLNELFAGILETALIVLKLQDNSPKWSSLHCPYQFFATRFYSKC